MDSKTKTSPTDINPLSQQSGGEPAGEAKAEPVQAEPLPVEPEAAGPGTVALEEEQVKDEIDIQIDLLADPDWVVRREAVITLGEMGDERCVEPLARALRDGDWQVREVAIEAMGQVGSPAVDAGQNAFVPVIFVEIFDGDNGVGHRM